MTISRQTTPDILISTTPGGYIRICQGEVNKAPTGVIFLGPHEVVRFLAAVANQHADQLVGGSYE